MRTGIPTRSVDAPSHAPRARRSSRARVSPQIRPSREDYERTTHDLDAYGFQRRPIFRRVRRTNARRARAGNQGAPTIARTMTRETLNTRLGSRRRRRASSSKNTTPRRPRSGSTPSRRRCARAAARRAPSAPRRSSVRPASAPTTRPCAPTTPRPGGRRRRRRVRDDHVKFREPQRRGGPGASAASGTRSAAPAEPRIVLGLKASAHAPTRTTPPTPAAAAVRIRAPTFPGSWTPSNARRKSGAAETPSAAWRRARRSPAASHAPTPP